MILVDTHALIWLLEEPPSLGKQSAELIEAAYAEDALAASAFSFFEVALLIARRRLSIDVDADRFHREALAYGVREIGVSGVIAVAAVNLEDICRDPADRIIVATALAHDATLITADQRLLDWPGPLKRHDART